MHSRAVHYGSVGGFLEFYVFATAKVMSRRVPTCASTHADFIMPPHWETRPSAPCPDIPISNIILTFSQPVLALSK